jgi:hypothetical protein
MKIRNWTLLLTLSALGCIFYFYITPVYLHPAEDAAILFNYAQNLKETGVISYYPGGPKVDGTTDFLFLLVTSAASFFTPDIYKAALGISAFAVMLMMFFIFRLLDTRDLSLQYLTLFLVFFSQQIWASVLGYGTMLYAMMICWAILAYWRGKLQGLAFSSFLAFVARPDALITVLPLLMHKTWAEKGRWNIKLLKVLLLFIVPSIAYLAFRYVYFGSFLPLSLDISTAGYDKVWGFFPINSIHHVKGYAIYYIWPGLAGLIFFIASKKLKIEPGYFVLILATIILPMMAYLTIRENLDFANRYFIVPYIGLVLVIGLLIRNYKSIILTVFGWMLLIKVGFTSFQTGVNSLNHYYNNMYLAGSAMGELPSLTLATSEAGIIPWKSRFKTMDVWGLNTPAFTHQLIKPEDILNWNPDLIVLHAAEKDYVLRSINKDDTTKNWLHLTRQVTQAMYEGAYMVYIVPYDWRQYQPASLESQGLLKSFFKWLSEQQKEPPSNRNDLIAVHPESAFKRELIAIIEEHGGEPYILKEE